MNAKFSSQTFEDVTKKTVSNLIQQVCFYLQSKNISLYFFSSKKSFLMNGLSSSKTTEWIFHVYGSNQELNGNYFKIGSGYGRSESSKERVNIRNIVCKN